MELVAALRQLLIELIEDNFPYQGLSVCKMRFIPFQELRLQIKKFDHPPPAEKQVHSFLVLVDLTKCVASSDVPVVDGPLGVYLILHRAFLVEADVFEVDIVQQRVHLIHNFYLFVGLAPLQVLHGVGVKFDLLGFLVGGLDILVVELLHNSLIN